MVRWGIISTAKIAERIVEAARIAPNAELVAVGSRDEARAREYAERNDIPRVHGTYEALLADPEVDAVYNPLPNSLHVPWSVTALEAGKHVLCEKPLSRSPEQVTAAYDAAERAGRLLMEAFMWRFQPQTEALAELSRDGTLGELRYARAQFGFNQPDVTNVRWLKGLEGGALMDVGCYCVSALRLVCGAEPERVSAELVVGGDGVDGRLAAVLRFPGDILATFDCGMDVRHRMGIEVVGSEATAWVPSPWFGAEPLIVVSRGDGTEERIESEPVHPYARELEELSAAIEGGPAPRLGRADSLAQARAIDALYRAAETGRAVTLA